MIYYMPFTYLSPRDLELLLPVSGHVRVCQPSRALMSEELKRWEADGLVSVQTPVHVDAQRLIGAVRDYKTWADQHRNRSGDLAVFFQALSDGPPLVDETQPTQISSRVRGFETRSKKQNHDPVFHACLFAAMAQEYDAHQDALREDLVSLQQVEREMFEKLSGGESEREAQAMADPPLIGRQETDSGLLVTDARIRAWAILAACGNLPAEAYVTTSQAVLESVLDQLPAAVELCRRRFDAKQAAESQESNDRTHAFRQWLAQQAFGEALSPWMDGNAEAHEDQRRGPVLTLYGLATRSPRQVLAGFHKLEMSHPESGQPEPHNFLFGHIGL